MHHGVRDLAQGKKGTGVENKQIGVRTPAHVYAWIEGGKGPRDTDTGRVLVALEQLMDQERVLGGRLPELMATALLEQKSVGEMVGALVLEALDARRKKK